MRCVIVQSLQRCLVRDEDLAVAITCVVGIVVTQGTLGVVAFDV